MKDHFFFFNRQTRKGKSQTGRGTKDKSPFHPERNYKLLSDLGGDSTSVPPRELNANEKGTQMQPSYLLTARIKRVDATLHE